MSRGRGREGIGEGRRESCEAPPAQGGEEGEEAAKGPQAESTLTPLASLVSPSLVGKWFTGIGRQGRPRFWEHFDLTAPPFICSFDLYLKSFRANSYLSDSDQRE